MEWNFAFIIEILGTFSFAAAGSFAAMEKKLDPFGVLIISFVTAIGGGTIRDVLIGRLPVAWLSNSTAIFVILTATAAALFFSGALKRYERWLFYFDALGLGLFTITGIRTGLEQGFSPGICIMLGTITGCFGGVLRDVLLGNVPLIFHREIYASACIAGGIIFFLFTWADMFSNLASTISIASVFLIRLLAVRYSWSLPRLYK